MFKHFWTVDFVLLRNCSARSSLVRMRPPPQHVYNLIEIFQVISKTKRF